jgi:hypothetical protein
MVKQFVQMSAHKDSNNFAYCSNLSLMANEGLTAEQALQHLQTMADEYTTKGYTIEWIRRDFDAVDEELYGDLFDDDEDDGQPDELTEWMDFDPDC